MSKKVFIAATRQNDGKTTLSLGLISILKKKFNNIGFIKPIGQRYLVEQGYNIDEDSYLIEEIFGVKSNLKDMSPVAIEKGFTQRYIENPDRRPLELQVKNAFKKIAEKSDLVVIEGTGHAGVGSVFDMSNAIVARMLNSKVIIVSAGGIGRPIDEVMLSIPLFKQAGVEIAGVIVNKVQDTKYKKIDRLVRKGFKQQGIDVLGVIPYLKVLDMPTMEHMADELRGSFISGVKDNMLKTINHVIVATGRPRTVLRQIGQKSLVVTSGDREELIKYLLKEADKRKSGQDMLAGFIITCGFMPNRKIRHMLEKSRIPVLLVQEDTFEIITKIDKMIVKIHPGEKDKIAMIERLVANHVDLEPLLSKI
jgi:dethiobiotin synthase